MPEQSIAERFWTKVDTDSDGCWLWAAARNACGYGRLRVAGKARGAHRVSWELHFGPIPGGLQVLHKCDTPACVRPDHLFLGTHLDNMRDACRKRRLSPLSPADVATIRTRVAGGESHGSIARSYGVWRSTVSAIVAGKSRSYA